MSTSINSIEYQFNPDKKIQALSEQLCREINGNGAALGDITVDRATQSDITIVSDFIWTIQVNLKSRTFSGKQTAKIISHDSANAAQLAAKKQGQEILAKSLGKIELINNIEQDPEHFFRHSSARLNGGPIHVFTQACSSHCRHGQVTCPRCQGKGTHKAVTKKDEFLGTSDNFSVKNTCPDCKGRGTINCHTCAGHGETSHIYEIQVTASSKFKHVVNTNNSQIKGKIEQFINHQSNKDLLKSYLSPVITRLEDIDRNNCSVSYQSVTHYTQLNLSVLHKSYCVLAFGDQTHRINIPPILDDTLVPAINAIVGSYPGLKSKLKLKKLQAMPLLADLFTHEHSDRPADELSRLLNIKSNMLLTEPAIDSIVERVTALKASSTPRYNAAAWLTFVIPGIFSGFYFGLAQNTPSDTLFIIAIHLLVVLTAGYLNSKNITAWKKKKLPHKTNLAPRERRPALLATILIISAVLAPSLLSTEQRWSTFLSIQKYYRVLSPLAVLDNETISNPRLIQIAQGYLQILGYVDISADGNYDAATAEAVKKFQVSFGIHDAHYLDSQTMRLLAYYSAIKSSSYTQK